MADRITKVQRWLDLIAFLVGRQIPIPVEKIMGELPAYARDWAEGDARARASVRRKFERDKDELRALGIPIETVSYRAGALGEETEGYRIQASSFYLPYLKLLSEERELEPARAVREAAPTGTSAVEVDRDQAAAAIRGLRSLADLPAFPLAAAARSALRKLTFDLDSHAFGHVPVLFAAPEETDRIREILALLSDALRRRKRVVLSYHGITRGADTRRRVLPWGLLFQHAHWYLVGWDEEREGERLFRVDRMRDVMVNPNQPNTPDFERPEGPVLEGYRNREAWELGGTQEAIRARVRFRFPTSLWAERNGFGVKLAEEEGGNALREFDVRRANAFLRWILSLAGEATIESPAALEEEFRKMVRETADLYRDSGEAPS